LFHQHNQDQKQAKKVYKEWVKVKHNYIIIM